MIRLPSGQSLFRYLPRGLGVDESMRLEFLRFDSIHQHPSITELKPSILTTHSMTCQSLYVAFPTTLPRRMDGHALGTDRNTGSRIRLLVPRPQPNKTHSGSFSSSSLKLRLWSVKSWTPAQILVTDVRIAGRAGETCHGTPLVRSISAVTAGLIDCTSSELVETGPGGSCVSP